MELDAYIMVMILINSSRSLDHLMQSTSLEAHAKQIIEEVWLKPSATSALQYSPHPPEKPPGIT